MKRIIILCLSLALLLACVPTPEEEFVVGKNTESMISAAVDPESEAASIAAELGAPERYQVELKSDGGHLTVSVDAELFLPDGPLPIVRAELRTFNEDDIARYVSALLGDDPYFFDGKLPKSYWRERLDAAIDAIDHWDTYGMNYFNEYDTIEEAKASLSKLQKLLNEAPDEPVRVEPDFTFQQSRTFNSEGEVPSNDTYFSASFVDASGTFGNIWYDNARDIVGSADFWYMRDYNHTNPNFMDVLTDVSKDLKTTQSEAEQQAIAVVQSLGLNDFTLVKSYGSNAYYNEPSDYAPVWTCVFTRKLGAGQVTHANTINMEGDIEYAKRLQNEVIYVDIDDGGVYYLRYEGPLTILETVAEQTNLKPFSEIQTIFERMVLLKDNYADRPLIDGDKYVDDRYVVTEIRLGLVMVHEQNKDTVLLVPAWDFLGHYERTWPEGNVSVRDRDECYPFLTINAVDGSIIDRRAGY